MTPPVLSKYHTYIVIALVALFAILAFWIRMIPAMQIGNQDILSFVGSDDPLYNLRQVELMLANFPTYAWWEPMTLFPYGTDLYWGPLTTYIAATLSLITGAATQSRDHLRVPHGPAPDGRGDGAGDLPARPAALRLEGRARGGRPDRGDRGPVPSSAPSSGTSTTT